MSKATNETLSELHGVVANELKSVLQSEAATAAHFGAAISFLKNNNITADPATNEGLKGLQEQLAKRRQTSKEDFRTAADAFASRIDGGDFGIQ